MNKKIKLLSACFLCAVAFVFSSCAEGSDIQGQFSSDVRNTQLQSPEIDKTCFSTVTMADGSENVKFTWPLVKGAGGYKVNVGLNTGNGIEPIITDSIVDGFNVIFPKYEDSKYEVSVLALGNEALNNKGAEAATQFTYSTMVNGVDVPVGEISGFINNYIAEHKAEIEASIADDPNNYELGFTLKEGASYTMDNVVNFGLYPVTLQGGDKVKRPTVTIGEEGCLMTQCGLKVKFINFDCTAMKAKGLLTLSPETPEELSTESLGYKALGGNQDCYVIDKPIIFKECFAKNLANSIIFGNNTNWAIRDFRIDDCIFQLVNDGSQSVIDMCGNATKGSLKDLTIKNSSIVNLKDNDKAYLIRLANASNAQAQKVWGAGNRNSLKFENVTFVKTVTGKNMADRYINSASCCDLAIRGCIFYDSWRLQKLIGNNAQSIQVTDNTIWGVTNEVDATDKAKYATEEDPQFAAAPAELDLSKPNGGLNLKPAGKLSSTMGDPRWK